MNSIYFYLFMLFYVISGIIDADKLWSNRLLIFFMILYIFHTTQEFKNGK
jgi:hypothetical protein